MRWRVWQCGGPRWEGVGVSGGGSGGRRVEASSVECSNLFGDGFSVGADKVMRKGACAEEAQGMTSPFGLAEEDGDKVGHVSANVANLPVAQG